MVSIVSIVQLIDKKLCMSVRSASNQRAGLKQRENKQKLRIFNYSQKNEEARAAEVILQK